MFQVDHFFQNKIVCFLYYYIYIKKKKFNSTNNTYLVDGDIKIKYKKIQYTHGSSL